MKVFRRFLGAALAVVGVVAPLHAEEAPVHPLKPMLWKVEGKKLEKPSWLFGTIHVGKGPVGRLHPAAGKALDEADALYTEIPMDAATQLGLAGNFIRKDGRTLNDAIGPELAKQLDAELNAIRPELNSVVLQSFKTWAVAMTLPMLKLQLDGGQPLDAIIWNRAEKAGKETHALEKPTDQLGIFDQLTEDEQVILLAETLRLQREAREKGEDSLDALVKAYVAGDDDALEAEIDRQYREMIEGDHAELGKKLMKRLIDDRNKAMAEGMAGHLDAEPAKSHFFAVGTAHYLGKANIAELLTKKGYKVTRVTE